ncbi:hypothetical protein GCM10010909_21110 [Acidocella aquatica]|uniref:Uncharacterized protein n=1 Tax=Acidocella aquatica TaxID=1922313 RepID=A0ABQ6ABI9_9PROT|nr:hypothetical protein GCM10010909_21110 [Acidocella aquatica]
MHQRLPQIFLQLRGRIDLEDPGPVDSGSKGVEPSFIAGQMRVYEEQRNNVQFTKTAKQ